MNLTNCLKSTNQTGRRTSLWIAAQNGQFCLLVHSCSQIGNSVIVLWMGPKHRRGREREREREREKERNRDRRRKKQRQSEIALSSTPAKQKEKCLVFRLCHLQPREAVRFEKQVCRCPLWWPQADLCTQRMTGSVCPVLEKGQSLTWNLNPEFASSHGPTVVVVQIHSFSWEPVLSDEVLLVQCLGWQTAPPANGVLFILTNFPKVIPKR